MNLVFVIDKQTRNLTWTFGAGLDKQHEPLMIGPESPRAGNILIFNNRYRSFYGDRQSTLLEIDPSSDTLVWQYRSHRLLLSYQWRRAVSPQWQRADHLQSGWSNLRDHQDWAHRVGVGAAV